MKSYSICRANRRHGSDYWYGRINEDGRVRYVSLRTKRKSEAAEWLAMMNARRFMPEAADTGWRSRDMRETVAAFLRSVEASRGAGSSTAVSYANRLAVLEAFCAEARVETLGGFTRETGQGFADALAARNYAPKTARELLRCASQFFRWAADTYEIRDFDPFARVARPKLARRRRDFWTPEQVDGILDAAPSPRVRLLDGGEAVVHPARCVVFRGKRLPGALRSAGSVREAFFGTSALRPVEKALKDLATVTGRS